MYHTHWGLESTPFPTGTDPRKFFEGASQREALSRLRYLVQSGKRLGIVIGNPGVGKSMLLEVLAGETRNQGYAVARCDLLGLSVREFYWQLSCQLEAQARVEDELLRLSRQVTDRLQQNHMQRVRTLMLLDNCDQAGADVTTQLERFGRWQFGAESLLTMILVSDTQRVARLGDRLADLVDLRIDLEPWDELDTIGYIQHALFEAGSPKPLFEEEALSELHKLAAGVPRQVNRLAENSLLAGSTYKQKVVDTDAVKSAYESLSLMQIV